MRVRTSWVNITGNIKAYKSYQQIYQALNHQYPDATKEELMIKKKNQDINNEDIDDHKQDNDNDNDDDDDKDDDDNVEYEVCGICRESMTEAKKLPCSHKFHLRCLMGWMRYKHTCPICRRGLNQQANDNNNNNNNNNNNVNNGVNNGVNNANNAELPWWLRIFGTFIQIHNVDIIDARNLNVRNRGGNNNNNNNNNGTRVNMAAQHRAPPNESTEEQIGRISEILGGRVSDQDIRIRLLRTHSMERTIEYFLNRQ